jgi:hypothetical protein
LNMKTTKSLFLVLMIVGTIFATVSAAEYPLFAGQDSLVGTLFVEQDDGDLTVTYQAFGNNEITSTNWELRCQAPDDGAIMDNVWYKDGLMNKAGNPKVGQMRLHSGDSAEACGDVSFIAAHCVVEECENTMAPLPTCRVPMCVYDDRTDSFFDVEAMGGMFDSFCTDWDTYIFYGPEPGFPVCDNDFLVSIETGGDWPKINYILNTYFVDGGNYRPVQNALWCLLDGEKCDATGVQAIIDDANENGGSYEPGCGDLVAINVYGSTTADGRERQPFIIWKRIPCTCEFETCWAAQDEPGEYPFPGNNWATYITFPKVVED